MSISKYFTYGLYILIRIFLCFAYSNQNLEQVFKYKNEPLLLDIFYAENKVISFCNFINNRILDKVCSL